MSLTLITAAWFFKVLRLLGVLGVCTKMDSIYLQTAIPVKPRSTTISVSEPRFQGVRSVVVLVLVEILPLEQWIMSISNRQGLLIAPGPSALKSALPMFFLPSTPNPLNNPTNPFKLPLCPSTNGNLNPTFAERPTAGKELP